MFSNVTNIPKKIDSPIQEAVFEIRYECLYPGEALYGLLFEIFNDFPNQEEHALPILQIPAQMRFLDPNFKYQPYYRAAKDGFAFAIGPYSIVFSALKPYRGWKEWKQFINPIFEKIEKKNIIRSVERIGLRTLDVFESNIFDKINAKLIIEDNTIVACPTSFFTEFDHEDIHVLLNLGNAANINGLPTKNSLIDIDCIYWFNCEVTAFFSSYQNVLEKAHIANKKIFFGLLKQDLLSSLNPEY